jgi:hypothetical protein
MKKPNTFDTFLIALREEIPNCPFCKQSTASAYVCKSCRVIHCWYCDYNLREIPKNVFKEAVRKARAPVDLEGADKDAILEEAFERLKNMPMDGVYEYLTKLVQDLKFACPDCKKTLDSIYVCEDGHVHCRHCDAPLTDLPATLWGICMTHEATEFYANEEAKAQFSTKPDSYVQ